MEEKIKKEASVEPISIEINETFQKEEPQIKVNNI